MSEAHIEVTYKLWLPRDQFDKKCIDSAQDMFFAILEVLKLCRDELKYGTDDSKEAFCMEVQDLLRQFRDLEE